MTVSHVKKAARAAVRSTTETTASSSPRHEVGLTVSKLTRLAADAARTIEAGLPLSFVDSLLELGVSTAEVHELVVKPRTLSHRREKGQPLSIEESDRAVRVARTIEQATRVFGDRDKAMRWLRKPKRRFDGSAPMDMLLTETGGRVVEEALIQVDEGMVA
jgi:putative toxin-antitoxin system antitoxin component (TIGR02293 family)